MQQASSTDQVTPLLRDHVNAQMAFITDLSRNLFQTAQQISELNMQAVQAVMAATVSSAQDVLQASNPQSAIASATTNVQPAAEQLTAFGQRFQQIFANAQAALTQTAEQHVPKTAQTARALADATTRLSEQARREATERGREAYSALNDTIEKSYTPTNTQTQQTSGTTQQNKSTA